MKAQSLAVRSKETGRELEVRRYPEAGLHADEVEVQEKASV